jgi:hypothetical protein
MTIPAMFIRSIFLHITENDTLATYDVLQRVGRVLSIVLR